MEDIEETPKKKKMSTGLMVGLMAILINVITVSVYMYQTNIMQKQQHAAVWPYLEWSTDYNDAKGFELVVKNNGIGPALIKSTNMRLDGENMVHIDTLCKRVLGTVKFPHLRRSVDNLVIPAGSAVVLLRSEDPMWSELLFYKLLDRKFEFEICYESIYEEQWVSTGKTVEKRPCK